MSEKHDVERKSFEHIVIKASLFDGICNAIEQEGNVVRNLSGWAFDVYEIYKNYKEGNTHVNGNTSKN